MSKMRTRQEDGRYVARARCVYWPRGNGRDVGIEALPDIQTMVRSGSASALRAEGHRFKSCQSDLNG